MMKHQIEAFFGMWLWAALSMPSACTPTEPPLCQSPTQPTSADSNTEPPHKLRLNKDEYFETRGLNVMAFSDFYPEGHQGGVTVVQHGVRVAANGDLRLEPAPGQWQPVPKLDKRVVDEKSQTITAHLHYPDEEKHLKGFNPIVYPDIEFSYQVRTFAHDNGIRVVVDLDQPLPSGWADKVGFNLELFPGTYFGKSFSMDGRAGVFPRQINGPVRKSADNKIDPKPLAEGQVLTLVPEDDALRMRIQSNGKPLTLLDGRAEHNNGWFVVRSLLSDNATQDALVWDITPHVIPDWTDAPRIHVSQVGYHPKQRKIAVIELDKNDRERHDAILYRVESDGRRVEVKRQSPESWGRFLRYQYLQFDFSDVDNAGSYLVAYGDQTSNLFLVDDQIFARHVWQPTLEYFLPVQMCHMRVNDRYRVWHGRCHMDDARMAPVDTNHFDGYVQGPSTLTRFKSGDPVPGLNVGGWHDAGDYDLRVESQIKTVQMLATIYEFFDVSYDATTVDQANHVVEMHRPDGVPDVLQQIEHGVLSVLGAYQSLGRLYRGIICPTNRQYVLLGDASVMTDNRVFDPRLEPGQVRGERSGTPDDRWVFTEENPGREMSTAAGLAAASRALETYRPALSASCLQVAKEIFERHESTEEAPTDKIELLVELLLATRDARYKDALVDMVDVIEKDFEKVGPSLGRVIDQIPYNRFLTRVSKAAVTLKAKYDKEAGETPFGMPYKPNIWGAGWDIQRFGVAHYLLHRGWPGVFDMQFSLDALNFVLGAHPGRNTTSFVSGVGSRSLTVAYGVNRADWSHIPGGVGSGTALIRPDLPELKTWPFFWQQSEYVIGGGGTNFMFLALAADRWLNRTAD